MPVCHGVAAKRAGVAAERAGEVVAKHARKECGEPRGVTERAGNQVARRVSVRVPDTAARPHIRSRSGWVSGSIQCLAKAYSRANTMLLTRSLIISSAWGCSTITLEG